MRACDFLSHFPTRGCRGGPYNKGVVVVGHIIRSSHIIGTYNKGVVVVGHWMWEGLYSGVDWYSSHILLQCVRLLGIKQILFPRRSKPRREGLRRSLPPWLR